MRGIRFTLPNEFCAPYYGETKRVNIYDGQEIDITPLLEPLIERVLELQKRIEALEAERMP